MSAISAQSARLSVPYLRWACLAALLGAEIIGISLRFDAWNVPASRPWHALTVQTGAASRVGLEILLATLLVAGPRWYRVLKRTPEAGRSYRGLALPILYNLIAFLCFFGLSMPVLEGDGPTNPTDWFLFAAWVLSGLATLFFWWIAVVPASLWVKLLSESPSSLLVGPVLGLVASGVGQLAQDQWKRLSQATLWMVHLMLSTCFTDTIFHPEIDEVGTSSFQVEVGVTCCGYEGMALIVVLVSVALWMFRRDFRFPQALLLLPVAMMLMWVANAVRITTLVIIGAVGYPDLALGGFHSLAGWILFLLTGLGLIVCAHRMPFFSRFHDDTASRREFFDGAYLVPAMALIATTMITTTFSPGLDLYYPARVVAVAAVLLIFRKQYNELRPSLSWAAVAIGCAVFALWMVLEPRPASASAEMPVRSSLESIPRGWVAIWLISRVIGSVITVPLAEELAFRGYLSRRLISSDFRSIKPGKLTWLSFLLSSVLFGVLHGRFVAGTLAGMAYALAYHRRGELTDAVVAHGVTNALIAAAVLATGAWSLWV